MHYKTNRLNHDFQIIHFIAGSCHTADGAYGILNDLREDRSNAIKAFEAGRLREQAKRVRAERMLKSEDEAQRLEGQADLAEIEAYRETTEKNFKAALTELATIEKCIASIEPFRQFKHLTDSEAFEAAQSEEWKLELISRAENSLLTTGMIPTDQFATMRLHPAFLTEILPAIEETRQMLASPGGADALRQRLSARKFDLPFLLDSGAKKL